jgi:transposase
MSASDTRAFIQAGGDYYLTPLAGVGDVGEKIEELLKPVWNREESLVLVRNDEEATLALGYETIVHNTHQAMDWDERILVVYSPSLAKNARNGLSHRLDNAEKAIQSLTPTRGRPLGGRPLGVHPLYIHREDHACGMIRLLSIAFRVLTLLDYVVRKELQSSGEILMGLYEGNPRRQTSVPTTERLLKAFDNIHLNIVEAEEKIRHVTPLSALQKHILTLLSLSLELYENLELSFDTS